MKLISPKNHFLFTPLLTSTTVGTIEFRSIIEPVRAARAGHTYYQGKAIAIDTKASELQVQGALDEQVFSLRYNELVIAVGAVIAARVYAIACPPSWSIVKQVMLRRSSTRSEYQQT